MNLLEAITRAPQAGKLGQLQNAIRTIKSAANPQAAMQQMMQSNQKYQQVMQMVQQAGGDPKKAFYQLANQMGVNPDEIIGMMK